MSDVSDQTPLKESTSGQNKQNRFLLIGYILILVALLVVMLIAFNIRRHTVIMNDGHIETIKVFRNFDQLIEPLIGIIIASPVLIAICGFICLRPRWTSMIATVIFIPLAGFVVAGAFFKDWERVYFFDSAEADNGNTYYFMSYSVIVMTHAMMITVETNKSRYFDNYTVVFETGQDEDWYSREVFVPEGTIQVDGRLYITAENWLLGVNDPNLLYIAYDLNNATGYGGENLKKLPSIILESSFFTTNSTQSYMERD